MSIFPKDLVYQLHLAELLGLIFLVSILSLIFYFKAKKDLKIIKSSLSSLLSSRAKSSSHDLNSFKQNASFKISQEIINILGLIPIKKKEDTNLELNERLISGQQEISMHSSKVALASEKTLNLLHKEFGNFLKAAVIAVKSEGASELEIIQASGIPLERMKSVIEDEISFSKEEVLSSNEFLFLGIEHRLIKSYQIPDTKSKHLKVWLAFKKGPAPDLNTLNFSHEILKQLSFSLSAALKVEGEIEDAGEDKDFLLGLSHDLRAPASAGIYAVYNLRKKVGNLEELEDINSFLNEQLEIIDNVLDLARDKKNLLDANPVKLSAKSILEQIAFKFKYQCKQNNIKLEINCPENIFVLFDKDHIERILQNFLLNSIRYSKSSKIILSVTEIEESLEFCIEDFGKGINRNDQKLLWKKFSNIQKEPSKGSYGLGLLICSTLAKVNNSSVFYRPNAQGGSVFGLKAQKYTDKVVPSKGDDIIYLLEDHPQTARAIINQLKSLNYPIKHYNSLISAENDLKNSFPKLVISDYNLSGGNIDSLINESSERSYPLLIISGESQNIDCSFSKKTVFLRKPVGKTLLCKSVKELINEDLSKLE